MRFERAPISYCVAVFGLALTAVGAVLIEVLSLVDHFENQYANPSKYVIDRIAHGVAAVLLAVALAVILEPIRRGVFLSVWLQRAVWLLAIFSVSYGVVEYEDYTLQWPTFTTYQVADAMMIAGWLIAGLGFAGQARLLVVSADEGSGTPSSRQVTRRPLREINIRATHVRRTLLGVELLGVALLIWFVVASGSSTPSPRPGAVPSYLLRTPRTPNEPNGPSSGSIQAEGGCDAVVTNHIAGLPASYYECWVSEPPAWVITNNPDGGLPSITQGDGLIYFARRQLGRAVFANACVHELGGGWWSFVPPSLVNDTLNSGCPATFTLISRAPPLLG